MGKAPFISDFNSGGNGREVCFVRHLAATYHFKRWADVALNSDQAGILIFQSGEKVCSTV